MSSNHCRSSLAGFDVVGDIHGQADKLEGLLAVLGYREDCGWAHPHGRQVIFIGDLIDLGPSQRRTVDIARAMVTAGRAQMIMGNHEFNAIAWATPDPDDPGEFLRPHGGKWGPDNRHQHHMFLDQVGEGSATHRDYIAWFKTLPLWLDLGELRIVHACWNNASMSTLSPHLGVDNSVTDELMVQTSREGSELFGALETVLKGPDLELPDGLGYTDSYGIERRRARRRWWHRAPPMSSMT